MMKAVKEILKAMTSHRMQANQGDHTVITCSNLDPHFTDRSINNLTEYGIHNCFCMA